MEGEGVKVSSGVERVTRDVVLGFGDDVKDELDSEVSLSDPFLFAKLEPFLPPSHRLQCLFVAFFSSASANAPASLSPAMPIYRAIDSR